MKFFKPAIAIMNQLKYPQKFALISCIFILPLSLLMYLLISEIQTRIDFAKKELLGTAYLRPLQQLTAVLHPYQLLQEKASPPLRQPAAHQNSSTEVVSKLESEIAARFQDLENVDRPLSKKLMTSAKLKLLQETWQKNLQENPNPWKSETKNIYSEIVVHQIDELRSHIGDQSNLILDPDLDTYYLMDATLLKLPAIQKTLTDIQLITQKISISQQNTPIERAQLIMLLGNLNTYNNELEKNMKVAFSNNPAGNLELKLSNTLATFNNNMRQLTDLVSQLVNADTVSQPDTYFALSDKNLKDSFLLWDEIIAQLDVLLQNRIDGFVRRQVLLSIFVAAILALVTYLFIGFYLGMMQTVSRLSAAAQQMIDGTLSDSIILDNRDELAEVVRSFNKVAVALVQANQEINLLNQRLKNENVRMSTELDITRKLQQMILPKESELNQIAGLEIAGYMEPAAEVGGDYYDVLQQDGQVKIGIGDVTGHGLESGVLMIMVQTAVRTLLANNETDPVKFLKALNRTIYDNVQRMNSDKNLTLALLDYNKGTLRLSGQHEEMIVVRSDGFVELIDTIDLGFPIGLEADIADFLSQIEIVLHSGDVVVLYTDGITEAENQKKEHYGLKRLCEIVKANCQLSAREIRQAVINDVREHISEKKIYDDITLLVLKQK